MHFVVCINNEDYDPSLLRWKVYQSLPNPEDLNSGLLRVIDEEGEDYLYPKKLFTEIELPDGVAKAFQEDQEVNG